MTGKIHRNLAFAALALICALAAAGCALGPLALRLLKVRRSE